MKTTKKMGTVLLLVALLFMQERIYAGCASVWTNPSLHEELNEGDATSAMNPCLSSDGLTIYANRYFTDLGYDYIFEAHRDSPDGPFTSMRTLTELHTIGYDTVTPWISHDGLRLYYTEESYGGVAKIKMATTPEPNSVWTPVTIFYELNEGGYDAVSPALTADELTIVFHSESRPGSAGARDLWTATRCEPNGVFGNITALDGINSSTDESYPHILPDGLTIYFTRKDAGPDWNIYKATRSSRQEPFGDIQYIGLNTTQWESSPYVTDDELTVYFGGARDGISGTYVSHWVEVDAFHVDGVGGDDNNDGVARETAFATIQKGVDEAENGCEVLVWPGTYDENVFFGGKAVTVQSADEPAVVSPTSGYAFEFFSAEGPDTVLKNLIIADGQYGIHVDIGCSPTIKNLTIAENDFGISAVENADPNISNCIFYNNSYGDIEGCEAKYSLFSGNLGEDLISYWNLDEGTGDTAYDSVGDNHGTLLNEPNWTTGNVGGALNFDGVDDLVEMTGFKGIGGDNARTVCAWIRTYTNGDIISWGDYGDGTKWRFEILPSGGNGAEGALVVSVGGGAIVATIDLRDGLWHHVSAVLENDGTPNVDEIKLYVDGQEDDAISYVLSQAINTGSDWNVKIGWCPALVEKYFNGLIDEVAVWDRALDAGEIQQIYNDGLHSQISLDPLFADAEAGDYHLRSERGRYWPDYDLWVLDSRTSAAIDGGNPTENPGAEPMPNGGRINMGAYGGTPWASMSEWPLISDVNRDGVVNLGDVGIVAAEWLSSLPWVD